MNPDLIGGLVIMALGLGVLLVSVLRIGWCEWRANRAKKADLARDRQARDDKAVRTIGRDAA